MNYQPLFKTDTTQRRFKSARTSTEQTATQMLKADKWDLVKLHVSEVNAQIIVALAHKTQSYQLFCFLFLSN